ncbi:MAG TPA: sigma-70 family RNA polymerase sigma factor [Solirubrobacteraceae bacterium]|nr:sigma-70 family RNA polymerase sigma factor [Solirubrobacteraceae bacterium]
MSEADEFSEPRAQDDVRVERFSLEESDAIASEARLGRGFDEALAEHLRLRRSTARAASRDYIRGLGEEGRLPRAAEHELILAAVAGDHHARSRLVEEFLPLIGGVARNYRSSPQISRAELIQEGVVGLLRALERYDPTLGTPFWAYASWWVRQAMQQLVAELTRPFVMSDRALRQLAEIKDAHAGLLREGRSGTLAELGERTGLQASQLANLIAADRPPKALEEPVHGEEGEIGTFGELIADPLAEDEYEHVVSKLAAEELRGLLAGLSERERTVLRSRYGLDGEPQSLRAVGGRMGLSTERVRQLENRALGKLRAAGAAGPPAGKKT